MALLHQAELQPSKLELLESWAPSQPWYEGEPGTALSAVGAFRYDDPEGEVGVEVHLVRSGDGPLIQVPVTYRGAPLPGGDAALIGTMQHSVLGERWVYDATGDPVYLLAIASAALKGVEQAALMIEEDGVLVTREPTAVVTGSVVTGAPTLSLPTVDGLAIEQQDRATVIEFDGLRVSVDRLPADGPTIAVDASTGADVSTGTVSGVWEGQAEPLRLVTVIVLPG